MTENRARPGSLRGDESTLTASSRENKPRDSIVPPDTVLAGRFQVLRRLGDGACGAVYAARDRLLGEDVALKLLHPHFRGDDRQLQRLRSEVRAARRISHPNVCRVHDLTEDHGRLFVAMELVKGETLRQRMRRPIALQEALELARQLGAGLAAAHRADVVHCDVKPENAILEASRDGRLDMHGASETWRLVITDFGIARLLGAGRRPSDGGVIEGTPAYMAPEQILGRAVDERTDVFALASVTFELFAGYPPFGQVACSLEELFRMVLTTDAVVPPDVPAEASPEARAAIAVVLARGLARDPAHRFERADAFVAALIAASRAGAGSGSRGGPTLPLPAMTEVTAILPIEPVPSRPESVPRPALSSLHSSSVVARARALRRVATVVHVLVDASEGADEELAADRIEALLSAAEVSLVDTSALIVARGLRVLTAVFGALGSSGDEPARAADAARAAVAAADGASEATVRVGIDTGRLLVRDRRGAAPAISGDAIARAAKLAETADVGEVRASSRSARHLARHFDLRRTADPTVVVVDARRRGADAANDRRLPLVGREAELARIGDALLDARLTGEPHSALVLGASGIGKSRFFAEIADMARARDFAVKAVCARPDHAYAAYAVLSALLREVLGLGDAPSSAEADAVSKRALCAVESDASLAPALAALLANQVVIDRGAALAAAKSAIAGATLERPLLLIVDDAQWADDATIDLLESLARGDIDARIAILALGRSAFADRRPTSACAFSVCLALEPLAPDAAEALAALHVGVGEAARALAVASDGNPFFIQELALDRNERTSAGADVALPSTVEDVIQARLDRLRPEEREVLQAAAILGRELGRSELLGLVEASYGGSPADVEFTVDDALSRLERRGLLAALAPTGATDDRYGFVHALVRDVAYRELPPTERRALHAKAARQLEVASTDRAEGLADRLAELARHLEGAGETDAAVAAYERAGVSAYDQSAPADALRCFVRAAELAGPKTSVALRTEIGEAAGQIGELAHATAALDVAIALAEAHVAAPSAGASQRAALARALYARASVAKQLAQWTEATGLLRRGIALMDVDGDVVLAAKLYGLFGWILGYILGDNEQGLRASERAVALLEGTPYASDLASALSRLGANFMRAGRFHDQLACNQRNLDIALAIGALELTARAHLNLGVNLLTLGRLEESAASSRSALALYERMRASASAALAHNNLAGALVDLGQLDDAARELEVAQRSAERSGALYFLVETECNRARVAGKQGDFVRARAFADAAVARATSQEAPIDEGIARRVRASIVALTGDCDAALDELTIAERLLRDRECAEHARVLAVRARVLARRGDVEAAARARAGVRIVFSRLGAVLDLEKLDVDDWI